MKKVRCIQTYYDSEIKTRITNNAEDKNYERIVSKERAAELISAGVCVILSEETEETNNTTKTVAKEEKVETAKLDADTETAVKKSKYQRRRLSELWSKKRIL